MKPLHSITSDAQMSASSQSDGCWSDSSLYVRISSTTPTCLDQPASRDYFAGTRLLSTWLTCLRAIGPFRWPFASSHAQLANWVVPHVSQPIRRCWRTAVEAAVEYVQLWGRTVHNR